MAAENLKLKLLDDVSVAQWIVDRLEPWACDVKSGSAKRVGMRIPGGLAGCARVFHPAYIHNPAYMDNEEPVRWAAVASWTGRTAHPLMQFHRIAGLPEPPPYADPEWGYEPRRGSLPGDEQSALVSVLRDFTATPDRCYFCLWDGYGSIPESVSRKAGRVITPGREYLLFSGPLDSYRFNFSIQSPNIWWPEDRAWCVATEIDLTETLVGGSEACIERILRCPGLEALPVMLNSRVDSEGDAINPPITS